jgi:hypothetical protein
MGTLGSGTGLVGMVVMWYAGKKTDALPRRGRALPRSCLAPTPLRFPYVMCDSAKQHERSKDTCHTLSGLIANWFWTIKVTLSNQAHTSSSSRVYGRRAIERMGRWRMLILGQVVGCGV